MENLKRTFLNYYFSSLNKQQLQAVFNINGPLLVLSGAGSGKTTVIVNRIVNMIMFGNAYNSSSDYVDNKTAELITEYLSGEEIDISEIAYGISENPIRPWNILAITFTNKAAGELKTRLSDKLGDIAESINASTFHSACARILRFDIESLGYNSNFTIYDTDDVKRLLKSCLTDLNIDKKNFPIKTIMTEISLSKNNLISPQKYIESSPDKLNMDEYRHKTIGRIYQYYQQRLKEANALDFDDLLFKVVELFEKFPAILEKYQYRYKYILVDEYQDTNIAQYKLISLLAQKNKNLCVVGDDDQSIYKFRGATIENILSFEKQFPDCTTIKLEQNYRSTQQILDAANSVIKNNINRKQKSLYTDKKSGNKIVWFSASDEFEEASYIADTIQKEVANGALYSDFAVLYRMNALSNQIERAFFQKIPYKIYGGLRFYDRKEIRDIIAYLSILVNDSDTVRMTRVINEPKRGIGNSTVKLLDQISRDLGITYFDIMMHADEYPVLSKRVKNLKEFADIIYNLKLKLNEPDFYLPDIIDFIITKTGYKSYMETLGDEGKERLENIYELKTSIGSYIEESEEPSLEGFLEEISLYTDVDNYQEVNDTVSLMTIHSSKGLEFKNVFIIAMEQGIFPSIQNMFVSSELEEERRLAYVAITRAKDNLTIITTDERRLFGKNENRLPSKFLYEIDKNLIEKKGSVEKKESYSQKTFSFIPNQSYNSYKLEKMIPGIPVEHKKFGKGIIISSKPIGDDLLLEISFDTSGTRKVMAKFARLKVITSE